MGQGGYVQIYNGTPYKWVRQRHVSSTQMTHWNNEFPMEILPNAKHCVYVEFEWGYFTKLAKTIGRVKYTFEPITQEQLDQQARERASSTTTASSPSTTTITNYNDTTHDDTKMWIEFEATAHPEFDISVVFSPAIKLLQMYDEPRSTLFTNAGLTKDYDDTIDYYSESIGWYHNDKVFFYLMQSLFVQDHYQTTFKLPTSYKILYKRWMTQHYQLLKDTPLKLLSLGGSHDSGMYKITSRTIGGTSGNTLTQHLSIYDQLRAGCRFFDLRPVLWKNEYSVGHYARVSENQGLGCNGPTFETIISEINHFTSEGNNELIILQLSHDFNCNNNYKGFSPEEWNGLFDLLTSKLNFLRKDIINDGCNETKILDFPLSYFLPPETTTTISSTTSSTTSNENNNENDETTNNNNSKTTTLQSTGSSSTLSSATTSITMSIEQPKQPCVLIIVEPNWVTVPPNSGIYHVGDNSLHIFDSYSETDIIPKMENQQLQYLLEHSYSPRYCLESDRKWFILNWILTQSASNAVWAGFGLGKGEIDILTRAEDVNPLLEYDLLLLTHEYEREWSKLICNKNNIDYNCNTSDIPNLSTPPTPEELTQLKEDDTKILTNPIFQSTLPKAARLYPIIPNIIFVDGFTPATTQIALTINLFHHARQYLRNEVYSKVPKTTDLDPTTQTDYVLHPFSNPPPGTEFSMYVPPSQDELDTDTEQEQQEQQLQTTQEVQNETSTIRPVITKSIQDEDEDDQEQQELEQVEHKNETNIQHDDNNDVDAIINNETDSDDEIPEPTPVLEQIASLSPPQQQHSQSELQSEPQEELQVLEIESEISPITIEESSSSTTNNDSTTLIDNTNDEFGVVDGTDADFDVTSTPPTQQQEEQDDALITTPESEQPIEEVQEDNQDELIHQQVEEQEEQSIEQQPLQAAEEEQQQVQLDEEIPDLDEIEYPEVDSNDIEIETQQHQEPVVEEPVAEEPQEEPQQTFEEEPQQSFEDQEPVVEGELQQSLEDQEPQHEQSEQQESVQQEQQSEPIQDEPIQHDEPVQQEQPLEEPQESTTPSNDEQIPPINPEVDDNETNDDTTTNTNEDDETTNDSTPAAATATTSKKKIKKVVKVVKKRK